MLKNRIKAERLKRGVKQETLAIMSGTAQSTISDIENERSEPSVGLALRISAALGMSVEELFYEDGGTSQGKRETYKCHNGIAEHGRSG